jgi:hypothetical protein
MGLERLCFVYPSSVVLEAKTEVANSARGAGRLGWQRTATGMFLALIKLVIFVKPGLGGASIRDFGENGGKERREGKEGKEGVGGGTTALSGLVAECAECGFVGVSRTRMSKHR